MANFKCPHCGGGIKTIKDSANPPRRHQRGRVNFASTAEAPKGLIRSFFWGVIQGRPLLSARSSNQTTLKIEVSEQSTLSLYDFDSRITLEEMIRVAKVIVKLQRQWSRANLCHYAKVSQPKANLIKDELVRMNMLYFKDNRYTPTLRGMALLRSLADR